MQLRTPALMPIPTSLFRKGRAVVVYHTIRILSPLACSQWAWPYPVLRSYPTQKWDDTPSILLTRALLPTSTVLVLVRKWPIITILAEDLHHMRNTAHATPGAQNVACASCARRDTHALKWQHTWAGESTERRPRFAPGKDGGPARSFEQDHV